MGSESSKNSRARSIFIGVAAYYLICGMAGMFFPESWLVVSGSRVPLPNFAIQLVGTTLFGFGVGFLVASSAPLANMGIVVAALFASALDIGAVIIGQREGYISQSAAMSFIVLDAVLVALFWWVLRQRR